MNNKVNPAICGLCNEPMPRGEEMFNYHGYSGPCPKSPLVDMNKFVKEKRIGIASCDWKNPNDMIEDLIKILPQFNLFVREIDNGSDSVTVAISDQPITDEEHDDIMDNAEHAKCVNIK